MNLDIRFPIGLMFTLVGAIIGIFGLFSDPALYQRSLGINVNLWWGLVMFLFGAVMLFMARRAGRQDGNSPK
jgi:multisubunit Na+/H+ antiporter MnhG subunit